MELKITPSGQTIVKPTALGPVVEIRVRDTWRHAEAAKQPLLRPHRGTVGLRKVAPGKLEAGHTVIAGDSTTTCSPAGTDVSFMVSSATQSSPRSLT